MFAIDGCKLPGNASKVWSGTKAELEQKKKKMETAVRRSKEEQAIRTMKRQIKKLKGCLDENDDKPGKTGKPKKSNLTDNESAKFKTSKGVIQGYDGVASVDSKHQVVIHAEAFGEAREHGLLHPMIEGTQANFDQD